MWKDEKECDRFSYPKTFRKFLSITYLLIPKLALLKEKPFKGVVAVGSIINPCLGNSGK